MTAAAHEMWARMAMAAVDLAKIGGLPVERLFDGLPFNESSLRKMLRVRWDDYCMLVERIGELSGLGLEDLLESGYHQTFPEVRAVVGALVDSKRLVRFLSSTGNMVFPPVEHHYEDLGGRHVRMTLRLRHGARPCETWFRGTIGTMRGVPRYLGQPSAVVSAEIGSNYGIYDITLPAARPLATRVRATAGILVRIVLGMDNGNAVGGVFGEIGDDPIETRLQYVVTSWKLTPRQTDVLRLLARGDANKDIANALACAENTVELHVTQMLRKTGATSRTQLVARMWSDGG